MKSFRDRNPYAVGLVSVLIIAALTGLAFAVGLLRLLEDTYTVRAVFPDAAGLRNGDEVRLAGVKVGPGRRHRGRPRARPRHRHDGDQQRRRDRATEATAEIALATLLGAKYVRLDEAKEGTESSRASAPTSTRHRPRSGASTAHP